MAIEVGSAFVSIVPSTRGFGRDLERQLGGELGGSGGRLGGILGGGILGGLGGVAAKIGGAIGLASIGKEAITAEADFSKAMTQMASVAGIPQSQIAELSKLALKMGADTVFSAQDAANAMLELAKGGLTAAEIKAGALQGTLTLAAAGGLAMGDAATYVSNALHSFGLNADQSASVAAALAGGANASSASVESLGQALSQVGPGAKLAGLSIQETVAALAAFDNAGVKGSDAGTSLKTMLSRLVPQTDAAAGAMKKLGLNFVDAKGGFLPLRDIAGQLQTKLAGLSASQKSTALTTIFGADAFRAAAILADQGTAGIDGLTKSTSDLGAAQRVADAGMKGTAGALEALSGSFDTLKIVLGQAIAPLTLTVTRGLTKLANGAIDTIDAIRRGLSGDFPASGFFRFIATATAAVRDFGVLIATGDFRGELAKLFGIEEDSGLVRTILTVRSAVLGIFDLFRSGSGTTLAQALGVSEGSPVIRSLLAIRDAAIALAGYVSRNLTPILSVVGGALAGLGTSAIIGGIATLAGLIGGVLVSALGAVLGAVSAPLVVIGALAGAFLTLYQRSALVRSVVAEIGRTLLAFGGFLTGTVVPAVRTFFDVLTGRVDSGAVDQFAGIADAAGTLRTVLVNVGGAVVNFAKVAGPVLASALEGGGGFLTGTLLPALGTFAGFLGGTVLPALVAFGKAAGPIIATAFGGVVDGLSTIAPFVTGTLLPALDKLGAFFGKVLGPAFDSFAASAGPPVIALVKTLGSVFTGQLLPALVSFATFVGTTLLPVFASIGTFLVTRVVPAIVVLATYVLAALLPAIGKIIGSLASALIPIVHALADAFTTQILPSLQSLIAAFAGLWPVIKTVAEIVGVVAGVVIYLAVKLASLLLPIVVEVVAALAARLLPIFIKIVGYVLGTVIKAIAALVTIIGGIIGVVAEVIVNVGKFVVALAGLVTGAVETGRKVGEFVGGLPGLFGDFISKAPGLLYDAGKAVIEGLIKGLKAAPGAVAGAIGDVGKGLVGGFTHRLGIGSPSKVFHKLGGYVTEGLRNGLTEDRAGVKRDVASLVPTSPLSAPRLSGSATGGIPAQRAAATSSSTSFMAGASITVQANDPAELQRKLESRARLAALAGGI